MLSPAALVGLVFGTAYLVGAIPFGYLVARARGVDILHTGSGNIGATNVGRVLGRRLGVLVFLLDFAKGALPVLAASLVAAPAALPPATLPVAAGVAAFLGHLFPIYLRFHGGKGVATAAGVVAVLAPLPFLGAALAWATVFVSTRIMSLASLVAAVMLCVLRLLGTPEPWGWRQAVVTGFCLAAAGLVAVRHHANVGRLLRGTENRFEETRAMLLFGKILHLLALGLWFGSAVFFSFVVGLVLFHTFEQISVQPAAERPLWLPLPVAYDRASPDPRLPDPLRKEQGSRIAGAAVGPLFDWYYGLQGVCALVALLTAAAWSWSRPGVQVHRARAAVLLVAAVGVGAGWGLERKVSALRVPRNEATDAVLQSPAPTPELVTQAVEARAAFGRWHGCSLLVNLVTVLLVAVAMILAALLPMAGEREPLPEAGRGDKQLPIGVIGK